jgi:inner membrane protein
LRWAVLVAHFPRQDYRKSTNLPQSCLFGHGKVTLRLNRLSSTTSHFIVGATLALPALTCRELTAILPGWTIPVGAGLLAAAPDLDFLVIRAFGIPYESLLSHRGFFHSPFFLILFAAVAAGIVTWGYSRKAFALLWLVWAGCMVTHPLMDALTDGGRGVMLLMPFTSARFFFPWRPLQTLPGSIGNVLRSASSLRGASFISRASSIRISEIPFCVASAAIGIVGLLARKRDMSAGA